MSIEEYRKEIDRIDGEISALFEKRMEIAQKIALYKKENSLPVFDEKREQQVLNEVSYRVSPEISGYLKNVYSAVLNVSKEYQKKILENETEE